MKADPTHADILSVRDTSRKMVRNLGFMRATLADTGLSPSSVHAIIEIGGHNRLAAHQLGQILLLEKSSVSRLLGRLVEKGLVLETISKADGRSKILSLTALGQGLLADIDRYANQQVGRALDVLGDMDKAKVVNGLAAYAHALHLARGDAHENTGVETQIVEGFRPGAIGRIAEMHGCYYAREWNFPPLFEAKVAAGLAEFSGRLGRSANQIWLAVQAGRIVGSAAIDGEDLGDGKAHLRWVIVDDDLRGRGLGRKLLADAVKFCDGRGFAEIHLWTFKGLDAARALYQSFGFSLVHEAVGNQWGREATEQRLVRTKR